METAEEVEGKKKRSINIPFLKKKKLWKKARSRDGRKKAGWPSCLPAQAIKNTLPTINMF